MVSANRWPKKKTTRATDHFLRNRRSRFPCAVAQISQSLTVGRGKIIRQFETTSVSWQWNGIFLPVLMGLRRSWGPFFIRRGQSSSAPALDFRYAAEIRPAGRRAPANISSSRARRPRPRPLQRANFLVAARELQHADVVEAFAYDLQPDRQSVCRIAAIDGSRRLLRHVERDREADVLEGPRWVVGRARQLGCEGRDRRGRRQDVVIGPAGGVRGLAHHENLAEAAKQFETRKIRGRFGPRDDERQHLGSARFLEADE